jgi:hypothetical protein
MTVGAHITITPELAIAVGGLAKNHREQSVTIQYDDRRSEQIWEVIFENPDGGKDDVYLVNDETGLCTLTGWPRSRAT